MLVDHLPEHSLIWLAKVIHNTSSGKTSPASCRQEAAGTLAPSSGAWQNSGMGGPTDAWTLATSESPSDAAESLLSAIVGPGSERPRCSLTPRQARRLAERLEKYGQGDSLLAEMLKPYC